MDIQSMGKVSHTALSGLLVPDTQERAIRLDRRGEPIVQNLYNGFQQSAVEGSYVSWVNEGTRGTGVNLTVATGTSYAATQALLVIANTNSAGGPDVVLDYVKILIDTAITAGTFWHLYHAMDVGNRYASGGTQMTGYAVNGKDGSPSGVLAYSGVVTASAATGSARDVGHNIILNGIGVANAELVIKFGQQETPQGTFTTPTTAVAQSVFSAPPIVIPPGWSYVMNEFQAARTATGVGEIFVGAVVR